MENNQLTPSKSTPSKSTSKQSIYEQSITENTNHPTQSSWALVAGILVFILAIIIWKYFLSEDEILSPPIDVVPPVESPIPLDVVDVAEESPVIEPQIEMPPETEVDLVEPVVLPPLNESDTWIQEQLSALTWRTELLKLVINDDMVRRFVVFTDNFSQGLLAYNFSPLVKPSSSFSVLPNQQASLPNDEVWEWDVKSEQRFSLYIELLKSFDTDKLVNWYIDAKPLINKAYAELGYGENEFSDTLEKAIARVLDFEIPKTTPKVIRPSVMYKYQDPTIEALDDSDKLLLRLGRKNVLIIKSVLLEFSEKLAQEEKKEAAK